MTTTTTTRDDVHAYWSAAKIAVMSRLALDDVLAAMTSGALRSAKVTCGSQVTQVAYIPDVDAWLATRGFARTAPTMGLSAPVSTAPQVSAAAVAAAELAAAAQAIARTTGQDPRELADALAMHRGRTRPTTAAEVDEELARVAARTGQDVNQLAATAANLRARGLIR